MISYSGSQRSVQKVLFYFSKLFQNKSGSRKANRLGKLLNFFYMKKLLTLAIIGAFGAMSLTSCTNESTGDILQTETLEKTQSQMQSRESEIRYDFVINVPAKQVTLNGEVLKDATEEESAEAISIVKDAKNTDVNAKRPGGIMCSAGMESSEGWAITMSMDSNNNIRFYFVEWYGGESYVYQMPGYQVGECEWTYIHWYLG